MSVSVGGLTRLIDNHYLKTIFNQPLLLLPACGPPPPPYSPQNAVGFLLLWLPVLQQCTGVYEEKPRQC